MTKGELKELCRAGRDEELKQIEAITEEKTGQIRTLSAAEKEGGARRRWILRRKVIAAMAALAILAVGTLFGPKVYAQIQAWIRGTSEYPVQGFKDKTYHFTPQANAKTENVRYELGWIPERYAPVLEEAGSENGEGNEYSCRKQIPWEEYYQGREDGWYGAKPQYKVVEEHFYIGWKPIREDMTWHFIWEDLDTGEVVTVESGELKAGEWKGEYYLYRTQYSWQTADFDGFWIDEAHNMALRLNGAITKEEAVKIIENIRVVELGE